MIRHVQGTLCITASYTCKSWYGVLNMYWMRFLRCLVSSHVSKGRFCSWLFLFSKSSHCSKEMTCNWDCVGCTVSGNQIMDPTGCWFGEVEEKRGKLLWHSSETWSTPGNKLVYWDQSKSPLMQKHNYSTSLLHYRTESLQGVTSEFLLWVRNTNGKIIKLCVIYFY